MINTKEYWVNQHNLKITEAKFSSGFGIKAPEHIVNSERKKLETFSSKLEFIWKNVHNELIDKFETETVLNWHIEAWRELKNPIDLTSPFFVLQFEKTISTLNKKVQRDELIRFYEYYIEHMYSIPNNTDELIKYLKIVIKNYEDVKS